MGRVGSKTKSLGQILEKLCVPYGGHIFSSVIMILGQNVFPGKISIEFENRSCGVKNLVTRSHVRKTLFMLYRPHIQPDNYET